MADYDYSNIEKNLSEGNYPAVYSELENAPSFLYGENDENVYLPLMNVPLLWVELGFFP